MKENLWLEGHPRCSSRTHMIPLVAQIYANPLNNNTIAYQQAVEIGVLLSVKVARQSNLSLTIRLARKEVKRTRTSTLKMLKQR